MILEKKKTSWLLFFLKKMVLYFFDITNVYKVVYDVKINSAELCVTLGNMHQLDCLDVRNRS
jgi:hypothetical protein